MVGDTDYYHIENPGHLLRNWGWASTNYCSGQYNFVLCGGENDDTSDSADQGHHHDDHDEDDDNNDNDNLLVIIRKRKFRFRNQLQIFDIVNKRWKFMSQEIPVKRVYHSMINYRQKLYVIGGITKNMETRETKVLDDVWEFDLYTQNWQLLTRLPEPRYNCNVCLVQDSSGVITDTEGLQFENSLIISGGYDNNSRYVSSCIMLKLSENKIYPMDFKTEPLSLVTTFKSQKSKYLDSLATLKVTNNTIIVEKHHKSKKQTIKLDNIILYSRLVFMYIFDSHKLLLVTDVNASLKTYFIDLQYLKMSSLSCLYTKSIKHIVYWRNHGNLLLFPKDNTFTIMELTCLNITRLSDHSKDYEVSELKKIFKKQHLLNSSEKPFDLAKNFEMSNIKKLEKYEKSCKNSIDHTSFVSLDGYHRYVMSPYDSALNSNFFKNYTESSLNLGFHVFRSYSDKHDPINNLNIETLDNELVQAPLSLLYERWGTFFRGLLIDAYAKNIEEALQSGEKKSDHDSSTDDQKILFNRNLRKSVASSMLETRKKKSLGSGQDDTDQDSDKHSTSHLSHRRQRTFSKNASPNIVFKSPFDESKSIYSVASSNFGPTSRKNSAVSFQSSLHSDPFAQNSVQSSKNNKNMPEPDFPPPPSPAMSNFDFVKNNNQQSSTVKPDIEDLLSCLDESLPLDALESLLLPRTLRIPFPKESVLAMIEFFYTGKISRDLPVRTTLADLYLISHLYDIPLLHSICSEIYFAILGKKECLFLKYLQFLEDILEGSTDLEYLKVNLSEQFKMIRAVYENSLAYEDEYFYTILNTISEYNVAQRYREEMEDNDYGDYFVDAFESGDVDTSSQDEKAALAAAAVAATAGTISDELGKDSDTEHIDQYLGVSVSSVRASTSSTQTTQTTQTTNSGRSSVKLKKNKPFKDSLERRKILTIDSLCEGSFSSGIALIKQIHQFSVLCNDLKLSTRAELLIQTYHRLEIVHEPIEHFIKQRLSKEASEEIHEDEMKKKEAMRYKLEKQTKESEVKKKETQELEEREKIKIEKMRKRQDIITRKEKFKKKQLEQQRLEQQRRTQEILDGTALTSTVSNSASSDEYRKRTLTHKKSGSNLSRHSLIEEPSDEKHLKKLINFRATRDRRAQMGLDND